MRSSRPPLNPGIRSILIILSVIFWIIGLIPIVNIVSGFIFGCLKVLIYLVAAPHYFTNPKFIATNLVAFLLTLIPFVNWIPWGIVSTSLDTTLVEGKGFKAQQKRENETEEQFDERTQLRSQRLERLRQLRDQQQPDPEKDTRVRSL
jgi:hypothetical protein